MAPLFRYILILIIVKPIVVYAIWGYWRAFCGFPIRNVEPVNCIVIQDFCLFDLQQVFRVIYHCSPGIHGEFYFPLLVVQRPIARLLHYVGQSTFGRHFLSLVQRALIYPILLNLKQGVFILLNNCGPLVLILLINSFIIDLHLVGTSLERLCLNCAIIIPVVNFIAIIGTLPLRKNCLLIRSAILEHALE